MIVILFTVVCFKVNEILSYAHDNLYLYDSVLLKLKILLKTVHINF